MKRILAFAILMSLVQTMWAQNIEYSPIQKFNYSKYDQKIIGWVGNNLFVFQTSSDGGLLNSYNDSLKPKAIINLDFIKDQIYGAQFYPYADKIIALYQEDDYGKISQYLTALDAKGMIMRKPILVGSEKKGFFSSKTTFFEYAISSDRSKIAIIAPNVKGKKANLNVVVYDTALKLLVKKTLQFKADDDLVINNFLLSNDGTLYAFAFTPEGNKGFASKSWILSSALNQRTVNDTPVVVQNQNELFLNGIKMQLDMSQQTLYFGGFFSTQKKGNTEGTIIGHYAVDSSMVQPQNIFAKFFDDKARDAMGMKPKDRDKAFDDYKVKDILIKNDSSVILVTENQNISYQYANTFGGSPFFYSPAYYYYGAPYTATITNYYYGNILLINLKTDGNPEWLTLIQKEQFSSNDGGLQSSYGFLNSGGSLVFIFNNQNNVQLAAVNATTGKLSMQNLNQSDLERGAWIPRQALQTDNRELVVPIFQNGGKALISKLDF